MRTFLVHEWLVQPAGSERVVEAILAASGAERLFTLVHDPAAFRDSIIGRVPVTTSFIQRLPGAPQKYQRYLPLMPFAIEQLDVSAADLVVSSHHAVAKGVLTRADQLHLSYVHSPMRYAWDLTHEYLEGAGLGFGPRGLAARWTLHRLREWDVAAANRVDLFLANSRYVARRVWRAYRRPARVLYPPVDVERFRADRERGEAYVTASRLVAYKRVDVVVRAFNALGRPLVVIGDGPERERLEAMAAPNVRFIGHAPEPVLREHLERARAFVFAADEDFGIVTVEAQAAGAPVIAFGRGGSAEIVVPGRTGSLFQDQRPESLRDAVLAFEAGPAPAAELVRANAERFSAERFGREWLEVLERAGALREDPVGLERALAAAPASPAGSP
jgi:glycosyltransferase involved in cell wall biosynthesis